MSKPTHLIVEQGPDQGLAIHVPDAGIRVGRSSKNDIVLADPSLSRHHCRLFFKPGDGLWVTDLGSSNQTVVNNATITEARLRVGDRITLGDSILKVTDDGTGTAPADPSSPIDLGLASDARPAATRARLGRGPLLVIALLMLAVAAAVWVPKLRAMRPARNAVPASTRPARALELRYEKVQATSGNIFRYRLELTPANVLSIQIDDVANNRHVRKEKPIDPDYARELASTIENAGFFGLTEEYAGIQPDSLDSWDLSVTIGLKTHRVRVVNRVEPEAFSNIRSTIETFGKNELGLWAIHYPGEKLLELAGEAYLLGRKLYEERAVKYGNLADAIKNLSDAEFYLETVEPKPDYYGELISLRNEGRDLLTQAYNDQNFRAERAIRLREWQNAATELRILLEIIPNRDDARNQEARKKLLDVENRLKLQK